LSSGGHYISRLFVSSNWNSTASIIERQVGLSKYSGPGKHTKKITKERERKLEIMKHWII
jgi:hypothetical protein